MRSLKPINEHFKAADRMAANLPNLLTRPAKRMQQRGILRELLAGLKCENHQGNR